MHSSRIFAFLCALAVLAFATETPAIGPGDLKKKLKKAKETVEQQVAPAAEGDSTSEASVAEGQASSGQSPPGSVAKVSTKYDYVPGDKILFYDDFTQDELGEFPARMRLLEGNFDVVDFEGERWVRLNGSSGKITPKIDIPLPEKWTLDFDYYADVITSPNIAFYPTSNDGHEKPWEALIGYNNGCELTFSAGDITSTASLPGKPSLQGRHRVSIMANGKSLKIYVDRERLVNVPEVTWTAPPTKFIIGLQSLDHQRMITNVRLAEGAKPKADLLAEGPFVTHGIYFDTGSAQLRAESAPVLRLMAAYMKEHSDANVLITGHTDNVGDDASNLTLSEERATAVVKSLVEDFGLAGDRLSSAGQGESAPIATNDSPEGRAMNRRVEFSKR